MLKPQAARVKVWQTANTDKANIQHCVTFTFPLNGAKAKHNEIITASFPWINLGTLTKNVSQLLNWI